MAPTNFSIELRNDPQVGKSLEGTLSFQLDAACRIYQISLKLACEVVTRRLKDNGDGGDYIKTDRSYPVAYQISRNILSMPESFKFGRAKVPVDFQLRPYLPASVSGPVLSHAFSGPKVKFEINYSLQPVLETDQGTFTGDKLPVKLFENPDLKNFDKEYRNRTRTRFRKEFSGLFGSGGNKGSLHATVIAEKLHARAGRPFELTVGLRNDSDKSFSGFQLQLDQHAKYNVTSKEVENVEGVGDGHFSYKIPPTSEEKTVKVRFDVPPDLPATTPVTNERKIRIWYVLRLEAVKQNGSTVPMTEHMIAISPLPWQEAPHSP